MKKRVAIGCISHESNSFSPIPTPLSAWQQWGLFVGPEILAAYPGSQTSVAAFIDVARREGWDLVPTVCAQSMPSAPTDGATYAWLKERLLEPIALERPDAVLLALHGAMMTEGVDDCEGDLVAAVRRLIGDSPLLLVLDLHGNISSAMCKQVEAVFGFDTNPHIDYYARGLEAAECLVRIFADEIYPVVGYAHPPMMPPTINMRTTEGPMAELMNLGREWEARPGILNVSIFGGFPYCDSPFTGTAIVVTADQDHDLAQKCADEIAARAWEIRAQFRKPIPTVAEAVDRVQSLLVNGFDDRRPVILADVADNPAGGGSGDTTELLGELLRRDVCGVVAGTIFDPETVTHAIAVGVGATAKFHIGGKIAPQYGPPLALEGTVRNVTDGRFLCQGPYGTGSWDMGLTAVIETQGIKLVVTSLRIAANMVEVFQSVGIEPADAAVLVIKSRGHFRAAFEPIAREIIEVDAPGAANVNLERFPFRKVTRPIWPLDAT